MKVSIKALPIQLRVRILRVSSIVILLRSSLAKITVQPLSNLTVPDERVLRLQDPGVRVGEEDQAGVDPLGLVNIVGGERLRVRHAVVALSVQDQHRRRESAREPRRIPLVDRLEAIPRLPPVRLVPSLRDIAPILRQEI